MGRVARPSRLVSILRQLPCPRRALDLGCGDDDQLAEFLIDHCNGETQTSPHQRVIVSLDVDLSGLRAIRRRGKSQAIQADLTALPIGALTPFDLVLIRHPDIDRARNAWKLTFLRMPILLRGDGILLVTTYSAAELDQINGWLKIPTLDTYPLRKEQLSPPDLVGRDRFVAVYSRKR